MAENYRNFWYYTQQEVLNLFAYICVFNGEVVTHNGEVVLCI